MHNGLEVKKERDKRNIPQDKLAFMIGVKTGTLAKWEQRESDLKARDARLLELYFHYYDWWMNDISEVKDLSLYKENSVYNKIDFDNLVEANKSYLSELNSAQLLDNILEDSPPLKIGEMNYQTKKIYTPNDMVGRIEAMNKTIAVLQDQVNDLKENNAYLKVQNQELLAALIKK